MNKWTIIIIGIIAIFLISTLVINNKLIRERNTTLQAQADLDAQLQRRFDLINQTVGATKGALAHEQKIFDDIAKQQAAFTQAHNTGNVQGELNANAAVGTAVGQALRGYFVVQQQYPNEQALQFVQNLQTNIDGSENRISVGRQRYNEAVTLYDNDLQVFPNSTYNSMFFHLKPLPYYQNNASSNNAPTVNLGQ